MKICAIIPAYNEAKHIADVVKRTAPLVAQVLVVDDGSSDDTVTIARDAGAEVLAHEINQGKGAALANGFDYAADNGFDAAVSLDADGQHLPEEIGRFVEAAEEFELVVGNRMDDNKEMPFVRSVTNNVMSGIVSWLAGSRVPDSQCGFRLIHCAAWRGLTVKSRNYDFESEMLVVAGRSGLKISSVPVSTIYGDEVSSISPVRDTIRFICMVLRLIFRR